MVHQIRGQLWRYFPQFLHLEFPLSSAVLAALWMLIPTPAKARRVRLTSVEKILKQHRIHAQEVLDILRATPLHVADGVEEAVVANLRLRFQQISMIETQLQEANRTMKELIQTIADNAKPAVDATSTEPVSEPGMSRFSLRCRAWASRV